MSQATYTFHGRLPRVVLENPDAKHEIRLFIIGNDLAVACKCMGHRNEPHGMLACARHMPAEEARRIWKMHIDAVNSSRSQV